MFKQEQLFTKQQAEAERGVKKTPNHKAATENLSEFGISGKVWCLASGCTSEDSPSRSGQLVGFDRTTVHCISREPSLVPVKVQCKAEQRLQPGKGRAITVLHKARASC